MPDVKFYMSDSNGDINLADEFTSADQLFANALGFDPDVRQKLWVKNEEATATITDFSVHITNSIVVTNTNNTPINASGCMTVNNLPNGTYSLTFPSASSVIVTPPGGSSLPAQDIVADGETLVMVKMTESEMYLAIMFNTGLASGDTATIRFSDAGNYVLMAPDESGTYGTFVKANSRGTALKIGDSQDGILTPGETCAFWLKQTLPNELTASGNPRNWRVVGMGSTTT